LQALLTYQGKWKIFIQLRPLLLNCAQLASLIETTKTTDREAGERNGHSQSPPFFFIDGRSISRQTGAPGKKKVATKNRDMKKGMLMMMVGEDRITQQHLW
jgi:hypothetical protein